MLAYGVCCKTTAQTAPCNSMWSGGSSLVSPDKGELFMRPGFGQFNLATAEFLQFAAQFGATDVLLNTPILPGANRWELVDLVKLRVAVEQYQLKLTALENVPHYFYDHIMLNGPRRDEQIENM